MVHRLVVHLVVVGRTSCGDGFSGGDGDVFVGENPETEKKHLLESCVCFFFGGGVQVLFFLPNCKELFAVGRLVRH